jgi:hypothetical protein
VLHCEGEHLDHKHLAGGLAPEVRGRQMPLKGLVIGDQGGGDTMKVAMVVAIVDLMLLRLLEIHEATVPL